MRGPWRRWLRAGGCVRAAANGPWPGRGRPCVGLPGPAPPGTAERSGPEPGPVAAGDCRADCGGRAPRLLRRRGRRGDPWAQSARAAVWCPGPRARPRPAGSHCPGSAGRDPRCSRYAPRLKPLSTPPTIHSVHHRPLTHDPRRHGCGPGGGPRSRLRRTGGPPAHHPCLALPHAQTRPGRGPSARPRPFHTPPDPARS